MHVLYIINSNCYIYIYSRAGGHKADFKLDQHAWWYAAAALLCCCSALLCSALLCSAVTFIYTSSPPLSLFPVLLLGFRDELMIPSPPLPSPPLPPPLCWPDESMNEWMNCAAVYRVLYSTLLYSTLSPSFIYICVHTPVYVYPKWNSTLYDGAGIGPRNMYIACLGIYI